MRKGFCNQGSRAHTDSERVIDRGRPPAYRTESIVERARFLDEIIGQLSAGHVVVALGEVIRHAATAFAAVVPDVVGELADPAAGCAGGVLEKGAVPADAVVALDAHARDLLAVAVPAAGIDGADAVGEALGDAAGAGAVRGSAAVDAKSGGEVEECGGEEEEFERGCRGDDDGRAHGKRGFCTYVSECRVSRCASLAYLMQG